jgi:hypothetical protein
MGTCTVDLTTKTIRFEGCEDRGKRRAAIKARVELLEEMDGASKRIYESRAANDER